MYNPSQEISDIPSDGLHDDVQIWQGIYPNLTKSHGIYGKANIVEDATEGYR